MNMEDVYGFKGNDLSAVASAIGSKCGLKFEERDSSFRAGLYFLAKLPKDQKFTLQKNFLDYDWGEEDISEEDFPEYFAILYAFAKPEILDKLRSCICSPEVGGTFLYRR